LKNSHPFGKNFRKPHGGDFLIHTVQCLCYSGFFIVIIIVAFTFDKCHSTLSSKFDLHRHLTNVYKIANLLSLKHSRISPFNSGHAYPKPGYDNAR